jgi:predicted RNA binding protein YcfA (HicA-like mRNA interferase family)
MFPSLRPREVVAVLERSGFVVVRIVVSHYQLLSADTHRHTTVPRHTAICRLGPYARRISAVAVMTHRSDTCIDHDPDKLQTLAKIMP